MDSDPDSVGFCIILPDPDVYLSILAKGKNKLCFFHIFKYAVQITKMMTPYSLIKKGKAL